MSTLLDDPRQAVDSGFASDRLRSSMAAMRLGFTWFGVRKALTQEQRAEAAETFGADGSVLSAGKRLIDTKHPRYKAVTAVRNRAILLWRSVSLPFPEPGIRLVRQGDVEGLDRRMGMLREELAEAVSQLDEHYAELKEAARRRLGRLYRESDYPVTLDGLFDMSWEWPSVEPPPYLRQLSPNLYEAEAERARARFAEAVQLAEQAFAEELGRLVSHLAERLSGSDDGKPKIFRDSAVENFDLFFERFRELNIGSSAELDELVDQARRVLHGIQPQELRDDRSLRERVASDIAVVQENLDPLLVERPRRNILRRPR